MARIARVVVPGLPHHITQRGNYQQDTFIDDTDRKRYLSLVEEYSKKHGVSLLSYCLMSNHVHYIAIPEEKDSLARAFKTAHMRYSQYFNKKVGIFGHLWQGRFYSCVLDELYLMNTARYIERNPIRGGLAKKPWDWRWSSAVSHINNGKEGIVKLGDLFSIIDMNYEKWRLYIDEKEDSKKIDEIKKHTMTGRPLGAEEFIKKLERRLGRRLRALPKGRPVKSESRN